MKTHTLKYKLYLSSKNNSPNIEIIINPSVEYDNFIAASIINISYIPLIKNYIDEVIENLTKVVAGELNYYEFGEEWGWFDCEKDYTIFGFLDKEICQLNTDELYEMLCKWVIFFKRFYIEGTLLPQD